MFQKISKVTPIYYFSIIYQPCWFSLWPSRCSFPLPAHQGISNPFSICLGGGSTPWKHTHNSTTKPIRARLKPLAAAWQKSTGLPHAALLSEIISTICRTKICVQIRLMTCSTPKVALMINLLFWSRFAERRRRRRKSATLNNCCLERKHLMLLLKYCCW
jgi:hypothetical protein